MYITKQGNVTRQAHVALPKGTYEEEHGRQGFFGRASHLYHRNPPTGWNRIEGPLRPHAFDFTRAHPSDAEDPAGAPVPMLHNDDITVLISKRADPMPFFFRNADGDEVYFVHEGKGALETEYGVIPYEKGDYIVIPRCTTYRVVPEAGGNFFLIVEAFSEIVPPTKEMKGLLGQHALYDMTTITLPDLRQYESDHAEYEVQIKREDDITSVFYPFHPFDVEGWKGDLYPWKINVRDIRPVMSHRVHLPPPVHTTLVMNNAVICSFLPRPLEEDADALKVPFYHRNADYDEVLFYHDGDFFSRDNIRAGMATLHPTGIHHGPHPKALENQDKLTRTDEKAIMIDTVNTLYLTEEAEACEWENYWKSWGAEEK